MCMWFGFNPAVNFCNFSTLLTLSFFAGVTSTSPKFDLYSVFNMSGVTNLHSFSFTENDIAKVTTTAVLTNLDLPRPSSPTLSEMSSVSSSLVTENGPAEVKVTEVLEPEPHPQHLHNHSHRQRNHSGTLLSSGYFISITSWIILSLLSIVITHEQ